MNHLIKEYLKHLRSIAKAFTFLLVAVIPSTIPATLAYYTQSGWYLLGLLLTLPTGLALALLVQDRMDNRASNAQQTQI